MVNLNYLYNPEAAKPYFGKSHFLDKKLGFQVVENGMILTGDWSMYRKTGKIRGGVVDSEGKIINGTYIARDIHESYTPPPNQFNTVTRPWFSLERSMAFGDIKSVTLQNTSGF